MDVYRATCDRRRARKRRAAQQASNDEQYHATRTFACGVFFEGENHRIGHQGVLVKQDCEVRVASVRNELIGDVRDMIACFLKDNRTKPSASRCDDVGGVSANWACELH